MAVNLSPVGGVAAQFFTNTGAVLTGGKLFTYAAGTTTPQAAYTASNGFTAWTNPIVLDAAGRVSGSGEIWLTAGISYKFVLKDSNDVLIATYDNVTGINSNAVSFTNQQEIITATAGQTVFNLSIDYQVGTNSLSVFVDGVNQYGPGAQYAYTETDSDTVTFTSGLHVGAEVKFTTTQQQGAGAVDASQVSYTPAGAGAVTTNVQAKLRQYVSVKDFGAVGNGVADDTAAAVAAVATGNTIFFPSGTYLINAQLSLAKGQELRGEGRNLTILKVPDAFNSVLVLLKQGSGVYDMTLTKTTVGTYSSTGTAIQVNNSVADSWNTRVQNVLIQNFNIADNITNYRHTRDQVMYFYNRYGAVVNYDSTAAGSTLFVNCAFLYTYVVGLTTNVGTTHTQVKASTFEFAGKHIQNDGVLYIDSCYIADFGAYCITGTGRLFFENGNVTPFLAGAANQGADYGFNFVTTDNQYALQIANGVINNVEMGVEFQFITSQSRRGSVLGPGRYVLNNCAFSNSASGGPSPFLALYPLEYSASIPQQISPSSTKLNNYVTNGTFINRSSGPGTDAGERNAWGGAVRTITTSATVPFSIPSGQYTLGDPLMLMIYIGTTSSAFDVYLNGLNSVNILADTTSFPSSTFRQFASEPLTNVFRCQTGIAYGSTYNVAITCLIVQCSALTGSFDIATIGPTSAKLHGLILTPIQNNDPRRVIGWFENP